MLSLSFDLFFKYIILILFIPSARCSGTFMGRKKEGRREREREFAFVYNIYACAHGRACTHVCRSMRVNVFVKLVLYVGLLLFLCVCVCVCVFLTLSTSVYVRRGRGGACMQVHE